MLRNKKILFCANDAGGANILIPLLKSLKTSNDILLYPSGPSINLWEKLELMRENQLLLKMKKIITLVFKFGKHFCLSK